MDLTVQVVRDQGYDVLAVRLLADGQDVVPEELHGVDPDWVLPPLSTALLPSSLGRSAMIGTCCQPGCSSFSVQVRRDGQRVLWEPDPHPLGRTLTRTLDFSLLPYLEAVDAAAADPQLQERGRRLARALEMALVRYFDKYDHGGRDVTVPMGWQTGDGSVHLLYQGLSYAVPLASLPDDDPAALRELSRLAADPQRLPRPSPHAATSG